jgi:hypothetical protein
VALSCGVFYSEHANAIVLEFDFRFHDVPPVEELGVFPAGSDSCPEL